MRVPEVNDSDSSSSSEHSGLGAPRPEYLTTSLITGRERSVADILVSSLSREEISRQVEEYLGSLSQPNSNPHVWDPREEVKEALRNGPKQSMLDASAVKKLAHKALDVVRKGQRDLDL